MNDRHRDTAIDWVQGFLVIILVAIAMLVLIETLAA